MSHQIPSVIGSTASVMGGSGALYQLTRRDHTTVRVSQPGFEIVATIVEDTEGLELHQNGEVTAFGSWNDLIASL